MMPWASWGGRDLAGASPAGPSGGVAGGQGALRGLSEAGMAEWVGTGAYGDGVAARRSTGASKMMYGSSTMPSARYAASPASLSFST